MKVSKEFHLIVSFSNGTRYSYYGTTKKKCKESAKAVFGNFRGLKLEWVSAI